MVKPKSDSDDAESGGKEVPKLSREQVEAWLAKHNRNAMSLLAAFRSSGDTNYLNEAATNFPDDPHVELSVLAHDEFPADRRKWLDLFKQSSPSNSLANYLSAQDDFKNGKNNEAVQELLAASGKLHFDNYAIENELDAEELYSASGKSPIETTSFAMSDMSEENMPELVALREVAKGIADSEKKHIDSSDANSAVNLAQMGMTLANQLQNGDSGKYLINQLVGVAEEDIVLSKLDQNTSYDFLDGQTPAQISDQLKQQKIQLVQITKAFGDITPDLTDAEKISFHQREIIFGETTAMQWAVQQHPVPTYPLPTSQQ